MRPPSSNNSTMDAGLRDRTSPIPYLYASFALMLGLITVALLILACSYRKSPTNSSPAEEAQDQEKSVKQSLDELQLEMEPKIVVIMAGDHIPSYLAQPMSHNCTCQAQQQQQQEEV